ncbi:MAG: Fur family transcriptional regulator [Paracoccaceae bacterium]|nr:Fur family transcriptional regulator [Paracoccaceae bacterium]MDE2674514.1 Fur family transcriptional regulator [Paracoccaceae bacterium]MDE2739299.1 Fur family transcriptional regulator [Paracoccaceae bacterium]MXZ50257.1 transcriptional repressor [Paracoccaceae bacterium]MYF46888.1 transcriptional repressor [Paracoccaceae bacterium]
MLGTLLQHCEKIGLRLTDQRRAVVSVLEKARDHPNIQDLYERASQIDPNLSIATVYRTVKLLEELDILTKLEFGDGVARYEIADKNHHDHLIDLKTGKVIEFYDEEIERLQKKQAQKLGYRLIGHRLELYGTPLEDKNG